MWQRGAVSRWHGERRHGVEVTLGVLHSNASPSHAAHQWCSKADKRRAERRSCCPDNAFLPVIFNVQYNWCVWMFWISLSHAHNSVIKDPDAVCDCRVAMTSTFLMFSKPAWSCGRPPSKASDGFTAGWNVPRLVESTRGSIPPTLTLPHALSLLQNVWWKQQKKPSGLFFTLHTPAGSFLSKQDAEGQGTIST